MTAAKSAQILAECGELVRAIVRHAAGSTVAERLTSAARILRLPVGRVTDWHYREVRRVEAWEADQIRFYAARGHNQAIGRLERQLEALRQALADMEVVPDRRSGIADRRPDRVRARVRMPKMA